MIECHGRLSWPYCRVAMLLRDVGPWPDRPRCAPRQTRCRAPRVEHAFPSGRAAILACLELASVGADSIVAVPECVTGCVADAVRRRARPVPLRLALASATRPSAAIVYEQWGWPLPAGAVDAVSERCAGMPLMVDRVDSADFFAAPRTWAAFEVLSLSKGLGLAAGGIARRGADDAWLPFAPRPHTRPAPSADHPHLLAHPAVRELFKQSAYVHPSVLGWVAQNCAESALEAERQARAVAARLILNSPLSAAWPPWMAHAVDAGAGPLWAPLLRGASAEVHRRAIGQLQYALGIRAAVRPFNFSGNPLAPDYGLSVALPIHGGLACPERRYRCCSGRHLATHEAKQAADFVPDALHQLARRRNSVAQRNVRSKASRRPSRSCLVRATDAE